MPAVPPQYLDLEPLSALSMTLAAVPSITTVGGAQVNNNDWFVDLVD